MKHLRKIMLALTLCSSVISANIINVPADIDSIQGGIDLAVDGDTVLVQPNTYHENINFNGKNIVVGSMTLITGDTSYISQTVVNGDTSGSVVIFENGEDSTATLCGFKITNGKSFNGAGIYCFFSNPRLMNLVITGNTIEGWGVGGGIYCNNSNLSISNISIIRNTDYTECSAGGGIFADSSKLILESVEFLENSVDHAGGGILCLNSELSLNNIIFKKDTACYGGAICSQGSKLNIENIVIQDCYGEYHVDIRDYDGKAGGIGCGNSEINLKNGLIVNNSSYTWGGGFLFRGNSKLNLDKVTVTRNYNKGGIDCDSSSSLTICNSILWNNYPHEICAIGDLNKIIAYSDIKNIDSINSNWLLSGNINADPMFIDTTNGNYRTQAGSPCIDAGIQDTIIIYNNGQDTLIVPPLPYLGSAPDMGAYEFDPTGAITVQSGEVIPNVFSISQNYPNPFNPNTNIEFSIPKSEFVTLKVYNILGEEVATLVSEKLAAGSYKYDWNASSLASGVYLYRIQAGSYVESKKMVLLR